MTKQASVSHCLSSWYAWRTSAHEAEWDSRGLRERALVKRKGLVWALGAQCRAPRMAAGLREANVRSPLVTGFFRGSVCPCQWADHRRRLVLTLTRGLVGKGRWEAGQGRGCKLCAFALGPVSPPGARAPDRLLLSSSSLQSNVFMPCAHSQLFWWTQSVWHKNTY